jgi:hypothetical protein
VCAHAGSSVCRIIHQQGRRLDFAQYQTPRTIRFDVNTKCPYIFPYGLETFPSTEIKRPTDEVGGPWRAVLAQPFFFGVK